MNSDTLAAIKAAVDADGDVGALIAGLPDGAAGQVLLAARACKRLRSAIDAIALACEGRTGEAQATADEAASYLRTMIKRLATAADLAPRHRVA